MPEPFTKEDLFAIRQRVLDSGPDSITIEEMEQVVTLLRADRVAATPPKAKSKKLTAEEMQEKLPSFFSD